MNGFRAFLTDEKMIHVVDTISEMFKRLSFRHSVILKLRGQDVPLAGVVPFPVEQLPPQLAENCQGKRYVFVMLRERPKNGDPARISLHFLDEIEELSQDTRRGSGKLLYEELLRYNSLELVG